MAGSRDVAGDLQRADAGVCSTHLSSKQNYAASVGRLWDEGKQSRLLMQLERPRRFRSLVAGATALAGESCERGACRTGQRPGGAVRGRTFRRRDAGAAEPRCDLHCDFEVRAVRAWRRWRPRSRAARLWPTIFPACARSGRTRRCISASDDARSLQRGAGAAAWRPGASPGIRQSRL